MKQTLRPYQDRATTATVASATAGRSPVLAAPTGSGKTTMGTAIVERIGTRTLWLAHRKELIDQAAARLIGHGVTAGLILAGHAPAPLARVQVASVATLRNREKPPVDLIVIDEAHHATADSYGGILEQYPGVPVVGLTATPYRLDGRGLGDIFHEIIVAATPGELIDAGYLIAPKVWAPTSPNLAGVKKVAGEYNASQLGQVCDTEPIRASIVAEWEKHAQGRPTIAFAINVRHSERIVEAFRERGHRAEHLDGTTPKQEREAILARLADGSTTIVSNVGVLTEGYDLPRLECVIVARPTTSLNLHVQMIGRALRPSEDKAGAIVLDHAGNHARHGLATRDIEFSLDTTQTATRGAGESLGLRRCRECGFFYAPNRLACPECGWYPQPGDYADEAIVGGEGELVEFKPATFDDKRHVWRLIETERRRAGFAPGWSFHRYREQFDEEPAIVGGELIDPKNATQEQKRERYAELLAVARDRGFADGWASHRYRDTFGTWPRGFVGDLKKNADPAAAKRIATRLAKAAIRDYAAAAR